MSAYGVLSAVNGHICRDEEEEEQQEEEFLFLGLDNKGRGMSSSLLQALGRMLCCSAGGRIVTLKKSTDVIYSCSRNTRV